MKHISEHRFRALVEELVDENPFAIRAVLRILGIEFTAGVPTLAVTCEERPRLLVNLDFVREHCRTDAEVKALLCHEFLHVLLRHTEARRPFTRARHLALDAVINAIIHREHGIEYSSLMSRYYADCAGAVAAAAADERARGWRVSRPGRTGRLGPRLGRLYQGRLLADDIEALAKISARRARRSVVAGTPFELSRRRELRSPARQPRRPDGPARRAEGRARPGNEDDEWHGIWRSPKSRGVGAMASEAIVARADDPLDRWRQRTLALLREHLLPDARSRAMRDAPHNYRIPVLSPGDRRAFLRAQWSPFLPEALWEGVIPRREGTAQIYLDVSGSMHAEMPLVIALLARLSNWIRRPFWAFSDVVAPAVIEGGRSRRRPRAARRWRAC
jgi:hypothetical protein